jgi:calcineurin-like phosphoesterase family protein
MVDRWNDTVRPEDTVYHLGDLAFGSAEYIQRLIRRLNGNIVLVAGNHDHKRKAVRETGVEVRESSFTLILGGKRFLLRHRPQPDRMEWKGADYHICGHVHDAWKTREAWKQGGGGTILNVGVDVWYFRPVRLEEVLSEFGL